MEILSSLLKMKGPSWRKPDFERFRRAVMTNEPGPVTVADIYADIETVTNYFKRSSAGLIGYKEGDGYKLELKDASKGMNLMKQIVRYCCLNGWDYAFVASLIPFGMNMQIAENTSEVVPGGKRAWMNDNEGPIMSWEDFEKFKWPDNVKTINSLSRTMTKLVPDGMKVMVMPGGVFEWTTWLMGLVPFSYALHENPELVDAVNEKVTDIIYKVVDDLMSEEKVGGIFMGDDLGFSTGTMISPDVLREKFFPNTKKIVDIVREADKVFVFHSCGNLESVMDDICEMGVHAKHSFEDKIMPVEEIHKRWGDRVAIIGGVDMDLLTTGTEKEIRKRTRDILDACASKGHYVLGTGNSVANYIPPDNYEAMLDEGLQWNMDNFGRAY